MSSPKIGDHVHWNSHAGEGHGKVVKRLEKPTRIKRHKVAASTYEPQFLVKTDDGKEAAHKAEALRKD
jgi:hypothetical protein